MKTIENKTDYETLLNQDKPILLDFYADWCGPCQTLLPTVDKLSTEYKASIEIQKVNVDKNSELSKQFEVRSIPALYFIKDTKIVDKIIGAVPENIIREKLEALLN